MDRQDSNLPDHDPAGTSFPRVERGERAVGAIREMVEAEKERYAAQILVEVRDCLRRRGPAYTLAVLQDVERFSVAITLDGLRGSGR
jgi:hypothetical protein